MADPLPAAAPGPGGDRIPAHSHQRQGAIPDRTAAAVGAGLPAEVAGGRALSSFPSRERRRVGKQACRQKWRALSLFILATLEAVESGIIPFEHAWMPYCLLASRETVGEHFGQTLSKAIESGVMPRLLLPGPGMKES